MSSFLRPELEVMVILFSLPVARSLAATWTMPFASMSKVTSICGTPRGAGGMPSRWKRPSVLLSRAIGRSPWSTCTSTLVCPSAAVLNTSDFLVGMVVLRWISCVATPPSVSMESVSGVTARSRMSFTSPVRTPPWTAAPIATTSSGLTERLGSLAKKSLTIWQLGHARRAAHQDDLVDLLGALLRVRQALLGRIQRALEEVLAHLLELRAGEPLDQVLGPGLIGGEEGQVDLRLHRAGELDLRLLRRLLQALEHHLVPGDVDAGLAAELLDQPVHDLLIHVVAAEVRVAVGGDHLDHVLADFQHRDVEGAAAVVEHGDHFVLLLVEAVGQGGCGGLVDDAAHFQASYAAGVLGGLALGVVEVGGDRDHRLGDGLAQVVLGGALQLLQDLGADLGRAPLLPLDLDHRVAVVALDDLVGHTLLLAGGLLVLAPHEALDGVDRVLRVGDRLAAGHLADEDLAVLAETHHGWGDPAALFVLDHLGVAALHDGHHRVGRPQVDSDDLFRHFALSP